MKTYTPPQRVEDERLKRLQQELDIYSKFARKYRDDAIMRGDTSSPWTNPLDSYNTIVASIAESYRNNR